MNNGPFIWKLSSDVTKYKEQNVTWFTAADFLKLEDSSRSCTFGQTLP